MSFSALDCVQNMEVVCVFLCVCEVSRSASEYDGQIKEKQAEQCQRLWHYFCSYLQQKHDRLNVVPENVSWNVV